MTLPEWPAILARYATSTRLRTLAREQPFDVVAAGEALVVLPSSGLPRSIGQAEFAAISGTTRAPGRAWQGSRNRSYIAAITADLENSTPRTGAPREFDGLVAVIEEELQAQIWIRRLGEINPPAEKVKTVAVLIADVIHQLYRYQRKVRPPTPPPPDESPG